MSQRRHFGSIRRRGRLFEASYWHHGQRHVGSGRFLTKTDAAAYLANVETDIRRGSWIDPDAGRLWVREPCGDLEGVGSNEARIDDRSGGADPPTPRLTGDRGSSHRPGRTRRDPKSRERVEFPPCSSYGQAELRSGPGDVRPRRSQRLAGSEPMSKREAADHREHSTVRAHARRCFPHR